MEWILIIAALFLAFNNGANDNFKGFASVWGSATLSYRRALTFSSLATFAGALAALFIAQGLVASFSGKGLVPTAVLATPSFMIAVASASAITVFVATRLGLPISTTHALLGGLVGAGLGLAGHINWLPLGHYFVLPLLLSPVLSAAIAALLYSQVRRVPVETACVCTVQAPVIEAAGSTVHMSLGGQPQLQWGTTEGGCANVAVDAQVAVKPWWDWLHISSAMAICFARGLNDTPKLAAILLASQAVSMGIGITAIGLFMLVGGVLFSRRVAQTLSLKLSQLDARSGLAANVSTALLVFAASHFALPVSTTHVAVGSITGVGASSGGLSLKALANILLSWGATLPLAAGLAFLISVMLGAGH